jgi:hypothetical protein
VNEALLVDEVRKPMNDAGESLPAVNALQYLEKLKRRFLEGRSSGDFF